VRTSHRPRGSGRAIQARVGERSLMPTAKKSRPKEPTHTCSNCGEPHDPYQPTREYAETEFRIIPPHDSSGKTMNYAGFQAPPRYARVIELLYSEQLTPWRTQSDVMRAFLDLGCHVFGGAIGGSIVPGVLHSLDMMNRLIDQAREANDFAQSIESLDTQVQRLLDGGMRESAVGLVYQYREQAKAMPDRILRRKLVGDINQRFAYLLNGKQGRKDGEEGGARIEVDDEHGGGHHDHESSEED
jgi:hypothetical protein